MKRKGGIIVTKDWVLDQHAQRKQFPPIGRYLLDVATAEDAMAAAGCDDDDDDDDDDNGFIVDDDDEEEADDDDDSDGVWPLQSIDHGHAMVREGRERGEWLVCVSE